LAELKKLWAIDPKAMVQPKSDLLFVELWREWESSPEGPLENSRDDVKRTRKLLFGVKSSVGLYANRQADQFTARDLKVWQNHLCTIKDESGELRLSRDTVRRCVKLVRQCFAWGVVEGKVDQRRAAALTLVEPPAKGKAKEAKKRSSIDKATTDKTVPFLSPPLRSVVALLWLTTARPSEVLGLRVEDIQRTGTLLLRGGAQLDLESEKVWAAILDEHKTAGKGFERVMFFGPKAQSILSPYLKGAGYLFKPSEGRAYQLAEQARRQTTTGAGSRKTVKASDAMRKPGEFYSSDALQKAIAKACKKALASHWFVYQIRITASASVMDKYGIEGAAVYMGHKPRGVTAGYVGANLRLAAKIAVEFG